MVGVDQRLDQRAAFDTRISTAWRWWRCGYTRISCRWLAENVTFSLTDNQPGLEYHCIVLMGGAMRLFRVLSE